MRTRLTTASDAVLGAALVAVCFGAPVVFTRSAVDPFMPVKAAMVWLAAAVVVVGLVGRTVADRRSPMPALRVWLPVGVLVAWTAFASSRSLVPETSWRGQYGSYDGFASVAAGAVLALGVAGWTWRRPARLEQLAIALVSSGAAGAAYLIVQRIGLDPIDWAKEPRQPVVAPNGLLGNSNFSGAHLAIVLPLAVLLATRVTDVRRRQAAWVGCGVLLAGLWWSGSRGALLALAVGLAIAGTFAPALVPRAIRWPAVAATVLGLGLILVAVVGNALPSNVELRRPQVLRVNSLIDRRELWTAGIHQAEDHPLTGVGPDLFGVELPYTAIPVQVDGPRVHPTEAHDVFIDRAATAGLPAVGAYLVAVGLVAAAAWRARRTVDERDRWLLAGFAGAAGAYLTQGLTSIDVVPLAALGWVVVAAVAVIADPRRPSRDALAPEPADAGATAVTPPRRIGRLAFDVAGGAVLLASIAGVVALLGPATAPLRADAEARLGIEAGAASGADRHPLAIAHLRRAVRLDPHEPRHQIRLGDELVASSTAPADARAALRAYDRALELLPGDDLVHRGQARAHVRLADLAATTTVRDRQLAEAVLILRRIEARVPSDAQLHLELAGLLERQARTSGAARSGAIRTAADRQYRDALAGSDGTPTSIAALLGRARVAIAGHHLSRAEAFVVQAEDLNRADPTVVALRRRVDRLIAEDH